MPYKFIDYFLLVDSSMNENKLSEKQKENRLEALLEENDNFDKFYSIIINKNYRDNFSGLNKFISDKYPLFVNYGVFLNLAKKRLDKIDFEICHMNDIEGDIGAIYKAFLTKYEDANKIPGNNKKELLSCKGKEIPILILGPCLSHNSTGADDYSINNYINNIEVGFAK